MGCVLWRLKNQRNIFFICASTKRISLLLTALKISKYGVISSLHFPVFGLNTEIYEVNLSIPSKCRNIQTRNNSVFGHILRSGCCCQIKFFARCRYGAVTRSISTSYWQMGTWLEKEKKEKWKNSSLKCKVLMKFEGEMNSMSALKKTKGYSGAWLASTKDPCNRKL